MARSNVKGLGFLFTLLLSLVLLSGVQPLRLQVQDVECFRENIATEQSQVTLTVVSDDYNGRPVYYDVMARDPRSEVVFSKLSLNDAELNFRNTVAGLHTFCLRLSQKSKTHADTIASPRVRPQLRTVTVDVQVGSKIVHGKLQDEDLATMMEEVSGVQMSVQNLKTTMVHMKTTGAHHRDVVFRKNRTVGLYSAGKLLVMLALFAVQPILLHSWFSKSY